MPANPVAEEAVRNVLLGVMAPELGDNIVDLGMVQVIDIDPPSGDVDVHHRPDHGRLPVASPDHEGHQAARGQPARCR